MRMYIPIKYYINTIVFLVVAFIIVGIGKAFLMEHLIFLAKQGLSTLIMLWRKLLT